MPYKSEKQARLMRAVAHGWKPTQINGPTRAVAKKFVEESEGKPIGKRRGGMAGYKYGGYADDDYTPGYQFGGIAARVGPAFNRAQQMYRGVPPQRGLIQRGAAGSPAAMADRFRGMAARQRGLTPGQLPTGTGAADRMRMLQGRAGALGQAGRAMGRLRGPGGGMFPGPITPGRGGWSPGQYPIPGRAFPGGPGGPLPRGPSLPMRGGMMGRIGKPMPRPGTFPRQAPPGRGRFIGRGPVAGRGALSFLGRR